MNPGEVVERYQIIREVGTGSMGRVYLALRQDTGQQVALKLVRGGAHPEDQERVSVEKAGAELQKSLTSNGLGNDTRIVAVHRVVPLANGLGIEMEYIDGEDLYTILRRGALEPQRAVRVALALCEMLDHVGRTTRFIHGDLKPRNVRLTRDDQVKVFDFGIAKVLATARPGTYNPFQSAPYCSPERLATATVDMQSDLWAIGVMLYEMISGRRPFAVPDEELRKRIPFGPDPLPAACPAPLRNIVFKMLAPNPSYRYPSAAECAADLRRYLAGQSVIAGDADQATRRTVPPPGSARMTAPMPTGARRPKWRRFGSWAPVFAFFAVIFWGISVVAGQFNLWSEANALTKQVKGYEVTPAAAWAKYETLDKKWRLVPAFLALRPALKGRLVEDGDEVIRDYRQEQPTATAADWERAVTDLRRALEIDSRDKSVRAKLEVCEAHLLRIRSKGTNRRMLNSAIVKFEDAARLMPDSRDPYLGLARIYFYNLHEYDKGTEMLDAASKHGQPMGKREKAQIADARRDRGIRLMAQSRKFTDMPEQEKAYLQNARDDFRSAADAYYNLGDFTSRTAALYKDSLRRLSQAEDRLNALNGMQAVNQ